MSSAAAYTQSKFSREELHDLKIHFRSLTKHRASMNRPEFREGLGILGSFQDSQICNRLFDVFSVTATGGPPQNKLNFNQFARGIATMVKGSVDEKLTLAFHMFDTQNQGEFTFEDLNIIIQSIYRIFTGIMGQSNKQVPPEDIRVMFDHLDLNRDGIVTMDEFKRGVELHSTKMFEFGTTKIKRFKKKILTHKKSQDITKNKLNLCLTTITNVAERIDALQTQYHQLHALINQKPGAADASADELMKVALKSGKDTLDALGEGIRGISVDLENNNLRLEELDIVAKEVAETPSADSPSRAKTESKLSRGRFPSVRLAMRGGNKPHTAASLRAALEAAEGGASAAAAAASSSPFSESKTNSSDMPPTPPRPSSAAAASTEEEVQLAFKIKACRETRHFESLQEDLDGVLRSGGILSTSTVVKEAEELIEKLQLQSEQSKALLAKRLSSDKGSSVFFGHTNWDLVMNIMQGIQLAVNRAQTEGTRTLCSFDFETKEKFTLVPGDQMHHGGAPKNKQDQDRVFRFIDYAPYVWRRLRQSYGIDDEDYLRSIGPGSMLSNLLLGSLSSLSELGSEGKSGSFFYFTTDGKYMVKTISESEHRTLRNSLKKYYHHMTAASDKRSLLCRIVGQHQIRKRKNGKHDKIFFVVQTNCFNTSLSIDRRFDLKGSWVDRVTKNEQKRMRKGVCLKDVDMMEFGQRLRVSPDMARALLKTLEKDSAMLAQLSIIDYSLLLGIHFNDDARAAEIRRQRSGGPSLSHRISENTDKELAYYQLDEGGIHSVDGKETYFMGIIDTLTSFNTKKKMEKAFKIFKGSGVSVAHPLKYNERFYQFMSAITGEDASNIVSRLPMGWEPVMKKVEKRIKRRKKKT